MDADIEWVSAAAARSFTEEGTRLAGLVSAEVGPGFDIRFSSYEANTETVHVRAATPAQNLAAEEAFTRLFEEIEEREAAESIRKNPNAEWIAYAPLSGSVFRPNTGRTDDGAPGRT